MHLVIDTLGQVPALVVTPANDHNCAQVAALAQRMQEVIGGTVEVAFVDRCDTGEQPVAEVTSHGMRLEVVTLPTAKRGFVVLLRH